MILLIGVLYIICLICVFTFSSDGQTVAALGFAALSIAPVFLLARHTLNKTPSRMECPNCGSKDVKITSRVDGVSNSGNSVFRRSYVAPNHKATINRQGSTTINRQRVAVCQSCGFDYSYITEDEVRREQKGAKAAVVVMTLFTIMLFCMGWLTAHYGGTT